MEYGKETDLFYIMQEHGTSKNSNLSRIMRNLPPRTISKSHLELMNLIAKQLGDNGFIVDESGLKNYNKDQSLKIEFNGDKAEYELHVKHIYEKNTLSEVAMFIEGGKYKGNEPYTPLHALQEIKNIIKNN